MESIFDIVARKFKLFFAIFVGVVALNFVLFLIFFNGATTQFLILTALQEIIILALLGFGLYGLLTNKTKIAGISIAFYVIGELYFNLNSFLLGFYDFYSGPAVSVILNVCYALAMLAVATVTVMLFVNIFINSDKLIMIARYIILGCIALYIIIFIFNVISAALYGNWYQIFEGIQQLLFMFVLIKATHYNLNDAEPTNESANNE